MAEAATSDRKWWIVVAMGGVGGLILLDETIIGVALPTIADDLGMTQTASHWVINAYMLAFACFAAGAGRLADIVGLRRLMIAGLLLFGVASLASGFAQSGPWLIAARTTQGLGAAAIFPVSLAIINSAFPKDQRGMAMGVTAAIGTAFLTAGPLVGGTLTEILSWRWIFWINAPIVAFIAVIVLALGSDGARPAKREGLDIPGLVTLVIGLSALVLFLMQGADLGWTSTGSLALLAGAALFIVVFVIVETRRDAPLIAVGLFRNPTFSASAFVMFVNQFAKIAIVVFGALYLQDELNMSPLIAGVALLVAVLGTPVMAAPAGRITDKMGPRLPALGGLAAATLGVLWFGLFTAGDSYAWLVPGLVVFGAAMPVCYLPAQQSIMNAVASGKQGQAGGIVMTARLLGGTISIAVCSGLLSATGSFQAAFLTTAAVMGAALVVAWFFIGRAPKGPASPS